MWSFGANCFDRKLELRVRIVSFGHILLTMTHMRLTLLGRFSFWQVAGILSSAFAMVGLSKNRLLTTIPILRWACGVLGFALMIGMSAEVIAAGCTYHLDGEEMASHASGLSRVYEGGRFVYYKAVEPCSGPNCGRSKSNTMNAVPAIATTDRNPVQSLLSSGCFGDRTQGFSLLVEWNDHYLPPCIEQLLRPPVC